MASTAAQINARIDGDLKRAGDRALARAGYSTTGAIRALWRRFASLEDDPGAIAQIIEPMQAEKDGEGALRARGLEAARDGADIFSDALRDLGIQATAPAQELTYDELRERALLERLEERGVGA